MRKPIDDARPGRWVRTVVPLAALAVLVLAGCGDDDEGAVDTTSPPATTSTTTPASTTPTSTEPTDDGAIEPGLDEFTDLCRNGDASGCRQLSDATLQEICDEGQTVACQTYLARTGEGDFEGDGTDSFAAGCRDGDLASCVQLSDATLQEICDEGQTAACQVYLSRSGDG